LRRLCFLRYLVKSRAAFKVEHVNIDTGLEQGLDNLNVAVAGSKMERGRTRALTAAIDLLQDFCGRQLLCDGDASKSIIII